MQDCQIVSNRPCLGAPPIRKCAPGKTCSRVAKTPRVWATTFDTGCSTDIHELDANGVDDACYRQTINYDYAVLATHPKTGVVYGVGVAPTRPKNLTCETAIEVPIFQNGIQYGNTCQGQINTPPQCGNEPNNQAPGLWYTIPILDEPRTITFNTCSPCTTYNTFIVPYQGECDSLECVSPFSNFVIDSRCTESLYHARFVLFAEANTRYYVYITGIDQIAPPAEAGHFELWVTVDDLLYVPDGQGGTTTHQSGLDGQFNLIVPEPIGKFCGTSLFRIDPVTCQPFTIGPGFDSIATVHDIAFKNNPDGEPLLYMMVSNRVLIIEQFDVLREPTYSLHTVNLRTGTNTKVGDIFTQEDMRVGNGIAFDCDDRLWLVSKIADPGEVPEEFSAPLLDDQPPLPQTREVEPIGEEEFEVNLNAQLFELDPETAAILSECNIVFEDFPFDFLPFNNLNPRLNALAYNKCSDQMFVIVRDIRELFAFGFNAVNSVGYLALLDTKTATVTMLNQLNTPFLQGLTTELLVGTADEPRCIPPATTVLGGGAVKSASQCTDDCCGRVSSLPNFGECLPRECAQKTCSEGGISTRIMASGDDFDQTLFEIFPRTAQTCERSELGIERAVIATHPGSGIVYGVGEQSGEENNNVLFIIEPETGATRIIASFEISDFVAFGDAAFKPSDGKLVDASDALLYVSIKTSTNWQLSVIGLRDGNVTVLGEPFALPRDGGAIAFDKCNQLYWVDKEDGVEGITLYKISAFNAELQDSSPIHVVGYNENESGLDLISLSYDACNDKMVALTKQNEARALADLDHKKSKLMHVGAIEASVKSLATELLAPRC